MTEPRTNYKQIFIDQLDEIDKLEATPRLVRDIALTTLSNAAKTSNLPNTTKRAIENGKTTLSNIGRSSLANNFKIIYSQMCVLAVSSLEALLKQYFAKAADHYQQLNKDNKKLDQIKVTLRDVITNELRFGGKVGDLILDAEPASFQDLKSLKRIFKDYFDRDIQLEPDLEKQVCFYLECRHVLVHKGGIVDKKFVDNTDAFSANLKNLKEGQRTEIRSEDWANIKNCFSALVEAVTRQRN